jgi:hypothetical protein
VALLPHWLGAAFVAAAAPLAPWVDPAFAARVPFGLLLALTLACVWYATFHLARTEAALPVEMPFGGQAGPVDYARALADAALLALIATLGLLQLGHETTPELVQLFAMGLVLWALAAAPFRGWSARAGVVAGLLLLASSGAPAVGAVVGAVGSVVCLRSAYPQVRRFARWVIGATLLAAALATAIGAWRWRFGFAPTPAQLVQIGRQWAWFMWPAWVLALWTLWRWRRQLLNRHVSVPLAGVAAAIGASVWMGGEDRALLLALPGLAVLAAFALPTLKRSAAAAIDWFSMFFFSACVLFVWAMYVAMQTGTPARWAANVSKLAQGFVPRFSWTALLLALAGTLAWVALVRWRTGRNPPALWKSMVIPAGGVALTWLLLMTLWLPLLDFARSSRAVVERVAPHVGDERCIATQNFSTALVASFEVFAAWRVDARPDAALAARCPVLVRVSRGSVSEPIAQWHLVASFRRPTERTELISVYRR